MSTSGPAAVTAPSPPAMGAADVAAPTAHRHRVFLVDDHPIFRNGLRRLIDGEADLCVCGECGHADHVLSAVAEFQPDIVLMDIALDGVNGIELTKSIRQTNAQVRVIMLSMHDESLYAERALRAGAEGYLMKHEPPEVVLQAIRRVVRGELSVSDAVASQIMHGLVQRPARTVARFGIEWLSDRELEVLELAGQACSTRETAERLHISIKTVETHKANIKGKLRIKTAAALTRYAVQWVEKRAK